MISKHQNYDTGFSGGKIVAAVSQVNPTVLKAVAKTVATYLNSRKGRFLTGCDLNFGEKEVSFLNQNTPCVLAALGSEVHYADATAAGVIGAVKASRNQLQLSSPTIIVHGCGAVGNRVATQLSANLKVKTLDLVYQRARIANCINISNDTNWITQDCDVLVMASASRILSISDLTKFKGSIIVCAANLPFANKACLLYTSDAADE